MYQWLTLFYRSLVALLSAKLLTLGIIQVYLILHSLIRNIVSVGMTKLAKFHIFAPTGRSNFKGNPALLWVIVVVSEKWGNRTGDVWAVGYYVAVFSWKASYPVPEFWVLRQQRKEWNDWVMSCTHEQSFIRLTSPVPGLFVLLAAKRTIEKDLRKNKSLQFKVESYSRNYKIPRRFAFSEVAHARHYSSILDTALAYSQHCLHRDDNTNKNTIIIWLRRICFRSL